MSSCQRCKQTNNGPQAFLLTCQGCSRTWHHRCHMPPVEDGELIRRIRATNAQHVVDNLSDWACRRCKKRASETPSAASSRASTVSVSTELSEDRKSLSSSFGPATTETSTSTSTSTARPSVSSMADVRVRQEPSIVIDARQLDDRERDEKRNQQESTEAAPGKRIFTAKRTRPPEASHPHVQPQPVPAQSRDTDVEMEDTTPTKSTPQEKEGYPQRPPPKAPLYQGKSARKLPEIVPETSSEDDVEVNVDVSSATSSFSESTSLATPRAARAPSSGKQAIIPESIPEAPPHVRPASSIHEQEQEVRLVGGGEILHQVNQDAANEMDDDPEDLYGPPVERRIIRILPSLAEELREQQRRVAAEKEKRRAPLAPDWISARHVHDPLWKEVPTEGRKRRKAIAKRLGDNGLNVNELMGCFTVQNWVREHKT